MKKILILLLCQFSLLTAQIKVNYVLISWHENIESDLAGYNVYFGIDSTYLNNKISCGMNDELLLVDKLNVNQKYFFAVTAYDSTGNESEYSNIESFMLKTDIIPPEKPNQKKPIRMREEK